MKYPAYPQYKDSGVAWLGDVPEAWEMKRIKFVFPKLYSGVSVNSENTPASSDTFGILKTSCVYGNRFIPEENKQILEEEIQRASCPVTADSLIISRMNTPELVGNCGYVDSSHPNLFLPDRLWIARFSGHKYMLGKFAWYLTSCDLFAKLTASLATGTSGSMKNLSQEAFLNIDISFPKYSEQTAIADFLDRETGRIDALVAKKRKLVELLKEKRSALISRTVTRGLPADAAREFGLTTGNSAIQERPGHYDGRGDFNRPQAEANQFAPTSEPAPSQAFKDSGVEWLEAIPENWEIKRLKNVTKILRGKFSHRPRNDPRLYDGDYPFIQTGDVSGANKFIVAYQQTLNEEGFSVSKMFPKGTLVMTIAANIGDVAILDFEACFPDSIVGFVPGHKIQLEFLYFLFQAMRSVLFSTATLNTQMNLNVERIGSLEAAIPPLNEQTAIATYLDRETTKIDQLVTKVETAITRLQEYRSALITAAVTGKIDVRGTGMEITA